MGIGMEKIFTLVENGTCAILIVEKESAEGIRRIAEKSAQDIQRVTGVKPVIEADLPKKAKQIVLYGTIGESPLLSDLEESGKLSFEGVKGFREVFGIRIVEKPWDGIEQALVVYGSEKRGTIYGIFTLSEWMGVSPLVFWGDAKPVHQDRIVFDRQIEQISKEPSVKYRGFFINDEWPCFGNWTFEHFGGFTAKMYDNVFELVLRLKGNYLWPAMWSSSFALDGPGEESAKLADCYGVIIGNSHHEPCLRASEEWDIYKGADSPYGDKWNYITNQAGLLEYWKDGLKRSGKYESIVTVGMRGERDSILQGADSLQENIDVLKDIISRQDKLIAQYADTEEKKVPRLLAIYKEVEKYFYGDKRTPGLKEWDGLDSIILMFCEDNYGNMRMLPNTKVQKHPGGYGMYYHLDYHGSPISYEWINSTPLSKIWEQMTECYEYGVRDVWIVNVGDLKGNEFPLSYFMALAYDFERWGTKAADSPDRFTQEWVKKQFGTAITKEQENQIQYVLTRGYWLTHLRRPEALNSSIYHPAHYLEADRMLEASGEIDKLLDQLKKELSPACMDAYDSMVYYPLKQAMNLLQMQLYAGKNAHYAKQGKKIANRYRELVTQAITRDRSLAREFGQLWNGKWKGMERATHIGFQKWNEDGCQYPVRIEVEPFSSPRMAVSRSSEMRICVKNYGNPEQIVIKDFLYPGKESVIIEVANQGIGKFTCKIEKEPCSWLSVSWNEKEIEDQEVLCISCNTAQLPEQEEKQILMITDGDAAVQLVVYGRKTKTNNLPPMTFYEQNGVIAIHAEHYARLSSHAFGKWQEIPCFGKTGTGLKAYPVTEQFPLGKGPEAVYLAAVEKSGTYNLELWSAPSNPLDVNGRVSCGVGINEGTPVEVPSVSEYFCGGDPENEEWCNGVLNQIHISRLEVELHAGVNEIHVYAMEPGFVLEELLVYEKGNILPASYLGPEESWHS